MGVQVLSPESVHHSKHLRTLPRIPNTSHYSMKPLNTVKPSRALPSVPNQNFKVDPNSKQVRALPRVPKQLHVNNKNTSNLLHKKARELPEVPFRDNNTLSTSKDGITSGSSRESTPPKEKLSIDKNRGTTPTRDKHNMDRNRIFSPRDKHNNDKNMHNTHVVGRALPKLPKLSQKQKPEQNRIEYMHDLYKKEGDIYAEDGNYDQALKSYNLSLKFISDEKSTIIARSRVYRKLGKPRKAMQDADLALKLDPIFYEGLLQKAELLLEQNDYEGALAYFQKGARMRPDKDDFHDGIEKAKNAISETHKVIRKRKNTISPEDVSISVQKKAKDKTKKNRDNANVQRATSNLTEVSRESQKDSPKEVPPHDRPIRPYPPAAPAPPNSRTRIMNGRQMTPMPGRLKVRQPNSLPQNIPENPSVQPPPPPPPAPPPPQPAPREEDVDNMMMKHILGKMYTDKDYLEKLLSETDDMALPNKANLANSAEKGLTFLYDRVLNWVRQGQVVPQGQPTPVPLPRDTKLSAKRKAMAQYSSVESIMEEQEKENDAHLKKYEKRKKKMHTQPKSSTSTWYSYLENKKAEEAAERKHYKKTFLHVVEGRHIEPREHSTVEAKKSKHGPEPTRRVKDGKLRRNTDFDSKESLSHSFIFKSYRPGSDLRHSKERRSTPMDISDDPEESVSKTPPRKAIHKYSKKERRQQDLERRREAVTKFATKELEDVELAYADGKHKDCMERAHHVLEILLREDWPDKFATMATLHSFLGNSCIAMKDYEEGLRHHNLDLDIGEKNKLEESVSRALGNLGRVYVVQKRHQEALDVFLRKTPMCASRIETAWLFHEIGNCFLALGDFEYAKDAAKKSLEAAEEAVEWSYQLQSCVLMGVAEVKLKQYHAAFNTFERALDQARLQGDEKAEDAIREAIQDVNDRIVEEMRTKGPMNYGVESRADAFTTPLSRCNSTATDYQLQGLSRSRAEIARAQAQLGNRCRADYAKTPAESDYSSIFIPDDDASGVISLTDTNFDDQNLQLDLERLRTDSTLFGSSFDLRDNIRSDTYVANKGK